MVTGMRSPLRKTDGAPSLTVVALCLLIAGLPAAGTPLGAVDFDDAKQQLSQGARAVVWYLGHSGWAVQTKNHLLIFDYWEYRKPELEEGISRGFIKPSEIADMKIRVFVSHRHGDHYDSIIHEWKEHAKDVKYIFGWKPDRFTPDLTFGTDRQTVSLDGMKISNVHHSFDAVPESAFLVSVDGLLIYHAGDHGQPKGGEHPVYKSNIDYLASLNDQIDLAFLPVFGGADYAIERLAPGVAVPMHGRGGERVYAEIKRDAEERRPGLRVFAAAKPGDSFVYEGGPQ
jgi:L-ascorbate metabolism protein UlaG (beta-lactamase superfamily)